MTAGPSPELVDRLVTAGVRATIDGPVARIVLNRPERRNSQRPTLWWALKEFGDSLPEEVRIVVVSAEGPAFSAGLDRGMFSAEGIDGEPKLTANVGSDNDHVLTELATYQAGMAWLRRPQFISIAAVQGHAVGAGFQLALSCDLRIAASDAQFTMAELNYGLVPDLAGTKALVEAVGYARALEICATCRRVPAAEADRLGIVQLVVEPIELTAAVDDLVAALLTPMAGAVRTLKSLLIDAADRTFDEQLAAERHGQLSRFTELASLLAASSSS